MTMKRFLIVLIGAFIFALGAEAQVRKTIMATTSWANTSRTEAVRRARFA